MKFNLSKDSNSVRFNNWEDFILERIEIPKTSNKIIVFVTFNLINEAKLILDYLKTQSSSFDILVVDNHSNNNSWNELVSYCQNINLIRTYDNLGSGGGNAIALEWALQRDYDYVLVTEDDASPVQKMLVDEMFNKSDENYITKIKYINENCSSFSFHFTVYPSKLLNFIGVPDPSFFMIQDDLEYLKRQLAGQIKLGISDNYLNYLEYTHPTYKPKKSIWSEYFDSRNGLYVDQVHSSLIRQLINFSIKIPYCWSRVFYDFNFSSLKSIHYALFDFVFNNKSFVLNKKRRQQIQGYELSLINQLNPSELLSLNEILEQNHTLNYSSYIKKKINKKTSYNDIIMSFIKTPKSVLAGNYLTLSHPIFMLSDEVIFVESIIELNNEEDKYVTVKWTNNKRFRKLRLLITVLISFINILILVPIIALKRITIKYLNNNIS
jgi:hypothetical protein